jgi:hypothetical protein
LRLAQHGTGCLDFPAWGSVRGMKGGQVQVGDGEAARALAQAHDRMLGDRSIQFQLPTADDMPKPPPTSVQQAPTDYAPPPQQPAPTPPPDPSQSAPPPQSGDVPLPTGHGDGGLNGFMQVFLWIAAGIALAILLYWLFTFFRDRAHRGREKEGKAVRNGRRRDEEAWRPAEAPAQQLLDEADVLASQGRYDEAVHLLLHRSIGEIDAHRPDLVRPALTSRDIARHPALPTRPAAAFASIVALVERSFFARRPLGSDDWEHCRIAYREFAFADGWQR